jgi:2-amino-4-hydroxy-6-hydroxymethyldihydropteridine diphosphokinase
MRVLAKTVRPARQPRQRDFDPVPAHATRAVTSFIGVGANLGDSQAAVLQAVRDIGALPCTTLVSASSLYRTAPVDSSGPDYVNAVVEVSTALDAHALLVQLQAIENKAGRARPYRNAPRTLDLDILLFGNETINTPALVVPHPRMTGRAFVLVPLAEVAPSRVTAVQLLAVSDQAIVRMGPGESGCDPCEYCVA